MLFISILLFIVIIGFLIFAHEFFHFLAAKRAKVKVEEFCIGFPPRIFKRKKGETLYSIGVIPFGGFVKMFGENSRKKSKGSFYQKSIGKRAQIVAAGVLSNFLIAIIFFSVTFKIGYPEVIEKEIPQNVKNVNIQIAAIAKDSPADKAGIKPGDKIIEIKTENFTGKPTEIEEVQKITKESLGKPIILLIQRGNKTIEKEIIPRKKPPKEEGPIGVILVKTGIVKYSLSQAISKGFKSTFILSRLTLSAFYQIIKNALFGKKVPGLELTGPIGAGGFFTQMVNLGLPYILYFIALLSLNLAIINAFPFPALDGGKLMFLVIEKIKKSPVKTEIENIINQIGLAILIILMIIITFKDIRRFF